MVGGIEEKTRLHLSISLERLTWLSFDIENPSFFSAARVKRGMSCNCQIPAYVMVHPCVWHLISALNV